MKFASVASLVSLVLFAGAAPNVGAAAQTPASGGATNQVAALAAVEIPKSVFEPAIGRNPFFPTSGFAAQIPQQVTPVSPVDPNAFILNGITSPPKRTAMINGRTFEVGEEGEVRLLGGAKVLIKCEEIRDDSAVISVKGQRREVHFPSHP
jgi:hypothetical protein